MMKVIFYGRKELRTKCDLINEFGENLVKLSDQMYSVMLQKNGVGLAANQIGIEQSITVIEIEKGQRLTLVNPKFEIVNPHSKIVKKEGCLSIPGLFANVSRYKTLLVKSLNIFGQEIEFEATELLARVVQHELDHLNGILYIDRINKQERERLNNPLKELNPNHEFIEVNTNDI